ncbi:MAG: DUF4013 domain-containing protein [Bacteroidia bacterium]|nr:DUF4013 domain-containing protein [Bacteroidia bacterium]
MEPINLQSRLSLRNSFLFPVQSALSRKDVLIGAALLLLPFVGWILNMGHRIMFVHQMHQGQEPFPAWKQWGQIFKHGCITWFGMIYYYIPAGLCGLGAVYGEISWLWIPAAALWVVATLAIPGYMTFYCRKFDVSEIYNPVKAFSRTVQGGAAYWKAWGIVAVMLAGSFVGLLGGGVGFLFTSVWFWQSAGFSFATVFTQKFEL